MKRLIAVILVVLLMASVLPGGIISASALTQGAFTYTVENGEAKLMGYTGSDTELVVPDTLGGYPVTSMGDSVFADCITLVSVELPDTLRVIGYEAFFRCFNLTSVKIPNSVQEISQRAFYSCTSLKSVTIPDSVTSLGISAFYNCILLESVSLGKNVKHIYADAFYLCRTLSTISIPESVISIGSNCFASCFNLTQISLPDSIEQIGADAFNDTAYYNNPSKWDDKVLYIGNHLIKVSSTLNNVNPFTIKEGTRSIAGGAFKNSTLSSIIFADTVVSIGSYAFKSSSVQTVNIPQSLKFIGYGAFDDCRYLNTVNYQGTDEQWEEISIEGLNSQLTKAKIYYRGNYTKNTYQTENILDRMTYSEEWVNKYNYDFYGMYALYTTSGGRIQFSFEGIGFEIISYKSPSQGKIYVTIDGDQEVLAADLYAEKTDVYFKQTVYKSQSLSNGVHTVEIRVEGKGYLDAISTVGEIVDCEIPFVDTVNYEAEDMVVDFNGSWANKYSWYHSGHNAMYTTTGGTASFTYTGYDFKIISYKAKSQGKMYISVDGSAPYEVDLYDASSDTLFKNVVFALEGLDYGTHTVTISTSGKVYLDAIKTDERV